jgi:hypothetical protein
MPFQLALKKEEDNKSTLIPVFPWVKEVTIFLSTALTKWMARR